MKLYHATSLENAENIMKEGFKISKESYEMALGYGIYFSLNLEDSLFYSKYFKNPVIIEIEIEINKEKSCKISNRQGIGTFYQNYDSWCKKQIIKEIAEKQDVDYEDAEYSDDEVQSKCLELYIEDAEIFTDDFVRDGCQAVFTETQCVVYDQNIISKKRIIKLDDIDKKKKEIELEEGATVEYVGFGEKWDEVILVGLVKKKDVNWKTTIILDTMIGTYSEFEIRLRQRIPIKILEVREKEYDTLRSSVRKQWDLISEKDKEIWLENINLNPNLKNKKWKELKKEEIGLLIKSKWRKEEINKIFLS